MMQYMNSGKPFSIIYITYNWHTGRGGAVKMVHQAVKTFVTSNEEARTAAKKDVVSHTQSIKNPNHYHNSTINIRISTAGNADIRKVHVQLIRRFNGAIVK